MKEVMKLNMQIDLEQYHNDIKLFESKTINELKVMYNDYDLMPTSQYYNLSIYLPHRLFTEIEKLSK
jgi:hypothetical protein